MTRVELPFIHQQHAHCESGVTVNLLKNKGIEISEPLAFGLGAGLFFVHFPFIKVGGKPAVAYRHWFVRIFRKSVERLGGEVIIKKFGSVEKGMEELDRLLDNGQPVAVVTNVYYLDYLPEYFRFQFSGHNLIVYGRDGDDYLISDPVMEGFEKISRDQLERSRFSQSQPRPKGKLYYIDKINYNPDLLEGQVKRSINEVCYNMTAPPVPWVGCNGIQLLAKKIKGYPRKLNPRKVKLYLSNIIQMQEVIGTGGGGFRFMYAAFLQEAGKMFQKDSILELSKRMTEIGDDWRLFATEAGKIIKERETNVDRFDKVSQLLSEISDKERKFFKDLKIAAAELKN